MRSRKYQGELHAVLQAVYRLALEKIDTGYEYGKL